MSRTPGSLENILWKVASYGLNIAGAILLSPYIIRKIGIEGYGVWALVFAIVEYLWVGDMGLRSATLKYAAHYRARGEPDKVNQVLNTALAYFGVLAVVVVPLIIAAPIFGENLFSIPPHYRAVFKFVFWTVGISLCFGLIFNVCRAALEGFQAFGILGRTDMITTMVRVCGSFLVLAYGGRLRALGLVIVVAQFCSFALISWGLHKTFPEFSLGPRWVTRESWRQMTGYGIHTLVATIASQILYQGPVVMIGALANPIQVGYYSLPMRLMNASDLAAQVGMVTGSRAAQLAARRELDAVARFCALINRYCLTLFFPVALSIWVYGTDLVRLWVGPDVAAHSAPVLMILVAGTTFGIFAQQNSSATLYGIAAHKPFAWGLMAEAILLVGGIVAVLPAAGLSGVAVLATVLLIANRGLRTAWLLCRSLKLPLLPFLRSIYLMPTLLSIPAIAFGFALHRFMPGHHFPELLAGCSAIAVVYYAMAIPLVAAPEHRDLILRFISKIRPSPAVEVK